MGVAGRPVGEGRGGGGMHSMGGWIGDVVGRVVAVVDGGSWICGRWDVEGGGDMQGGHESGPVLGSGSTGRGAFGRIRCEARMGAG
jgi:hypothetical protein